MASETAPSRAVMRSPRSVSLAITSKCNLQCSYCYYFNNPGINYSDLPSGDWIRFFEELRRMTVMDVCLAGGEPFLRPDLKDLIANIVHNRMRFSVLSNGSLIGDEIAEFMSSTGRCNYVQISLDGSQAEIHDSCRGRSSFDGAVRGIKTLQRHGVPVTVRVTIHHRNVQDLDDIARFLLKDLGIASFSTNSAGYLGSCRINARDILLTREDRETAMRALLRLSEEYKGRISAMAGPLAEARSWQRMAEDSRMKDKHVNPKGGHLADCRLLFNRISVRSDGVIIPCAMLPSIELGRINHDSLQDVWQNSQSLNNLRSRHRLSLAEFAFCEGCEYIPYCTGNCPALAYSLTGKIDHPSPDACLKKFQLEGGRLPESQGETGSKAFSKTGR